MILILGKPIPFHNVKLSASAANVLEIDVESAWKEMDLSSGWSNEVGVEVLVG